MSGFVISRDLINAGTEYDRTGRDYGAPALDGYPVSFRLYDDDNELYYEGHATCQAGAELAHDWGQSDAGVTNSQIRLPFGVWQAFIG